MAKPASPKQNAKILISLLILSLFSIFSTFPLWHILGVSFRGNNAFQTHDFSMWTAASSLANYQDLFTKTLFLTWLRNSLLLSVSVTLLGLVLATTAAYALSRFRVHGKNSLLLTLLATQMFPATMLLLPFYILLSKLHLVNQFTGLLIVYSSSALPFCIWQMKAYFDTLPKELEDSARVDGCSRLQVLWKIVLPIAKPALAITALFQFTSAWSEYAVASVVLQDPDLYTLPLGLKSFQASMSTQWGYYAAAAILISIPAIAGFLFFSRYLISGLTLGSVKG